MLVIKDIVPFNIDYPLEKICLKEDIIYFDIETTGFSRKHCIVYLIGCMYYDNDTLCYTQWLAENFSEEAVILSEFYKKLSHFKTIIHFNGNRFDMPFLTERGVLYNIDFNFKEYESVDLYNRVSQCASLLKLENLRQKTFEKLLGIERTDPFSGGDLVEVYKEYVGSKDARLLKVLLLHNAEDVFHMGALTSLLALRDLIDEKFKVTDFGLNEFTDIDGELQQELSIKLTLENELKFQISYKKDDIYITGYGNSLHITVKTFSGELKFFFDNYKEYYYLPEEDTSIHKSIASFVDKAHRKNATAATCYTKKTDTFLPLWNNNNNTFSPLFRADIKDKQFWFCIEKLKEDNIKAYSMSLLKYLCM